MLRDLIYSAGGRGFVFALLASAFTAGYVILHDMTWAQWVDYNKVIGLAFLTAKGIEGAADSIATKRGGG